MEMTINKHWVTVNTGHELIVTVARLRTNGGVPKRVTKVYDKTISFSKCLASITNITLLDDEMYNMVAEHCDTLQ